MKSKARYWIPILLCCLLVGSLAYGGWIWYDNNVDRSGWTAENGQLYYQDFHGKRLSGWQEVDGLLFCFRDDGSALTGWQDIGGKRYYFSAEGVCALGWQEMEDGWHYFGTDGAMHQGFSTIQDKTYYLPGGIMATGWQEIDGKRYYFAPDGPMAVGLTRIKLDNYYFSQDGTIVTGELELEDGKYFFGEDGAMHTGWLELEEGRHYYLREGPMALGWQVIEDKNYLFQENGFPTIGWHQEGEYQYYFHPDGSAAVGPTEIDGNLHHFTPRGMEVVLVNGNIKVPDWYDPDLKPIADKHQVASKCYDALVAMLDGCVAAGIEYDFNSSYRTIQAQRDILYFRTLEYVEDQGMDQSDARAKALRTVAKPGSSEHHLGLAVDLLGKEAKLWFQEHCWDYGFIVRYLPGKERWTGIATEDWHFRYVGKEIALELKENGLTLEEYLGAEPVKPWLE